MSVCLLQAGIEMVGFLHRGYLHCVIRELVSPKEWVLPSETFPKSQNFAGCFCFFATSRRPSQVLSSLFDRREFLTLSKHICLQHVGCSAERRPVYLRVWQLRFNILSQKQHAGVSVTPAVFMSWSLCLIKCLFVPSNK